MDYQIIAVSNEQFLIKPNQKIVVNGLSALAVGQTLEAQILLSHTGNLLEIGTPYLDRTQTFKVAKHLQSQKIKVATFRAKSRYRKVKGHRQWQSVLEAVDTPPKKTAKK